MKPQLNQKPNFVSYIHGGYYLLSLTQKEMCLHTMLLPIFLNWRRRGNTKAPEKGLQQSCKRSDITEKTFKKHLEKDVLISLRNTQILVQS